MQEEAVKPEDQQAASGPSQPAEPDKPTDVGAGQSEQAAPVEGAAADTQQQVEAVATPKEGGRKKKWMAVLIIVLVLGLGAVVLGFLSGRRAKQAKSEKQEERVVTTPVVEKKDALTVQYGEQSSSDEIADIERDLNNTSFAGIDEELTDIDKEISSKN